MLNKYQPYFISILPGILVFILANFISFLNPILSGLLLGILVGNLRTLPTSIQTISVKAGNRFLELSVLFLAFGINYSHLSKLGWESLVVVFLMVFIVLFVVFLWSKNPLNWMIGFGTAICGTSAIAALAPTLEKDKGDTGIAMAVVNLYGMLGMIILPLILLKLDLKPIQDALIVGGSLHSVGNVAGAGFMISDKVGELSVTVKLARVALLSFGLIFFNFLTKNRKNVSWTHNFKLPWYIWGFILITILVSFFPLSDLFSKSADTLGKLLLTIAMTNIGMQIRFKELIQSGRKGLLFGLGIWSFQIILLAVLILIFL